MVHVQLCETYISEILETISHFICINVLPVINSFCIIMELVLMYNLLSDCWLLHCHTSLAIGNYFQLKIIKD